MEKKKLSKKLIIIPVIIIICIIIISPLLNGINTVPFKFRDDAVSFLTPNLNWGSRPSEIILKYGFPDEIDGISDITGERSFDFNFVHDEKDVTLYVTNRYLLNAVPHRYTFVIDCKTPENASAYFDECHNKIMDFYKDDANFQFKYTNTWTDYKYSDGSICSYFSEYEDGVEKIYIIDDDLNEIPLEKAENVVAVKTKENYYSSFSTTGTTYSLSYCEGESTVTWRGEILY